MSEALLKEAKELAKNHPSKDCRFFAEQVAVYLTMQIGEEKIKRLKDSLFDTKRFLLGLAQTEEVKSAIKGVDYLVDHYSGER